MLKIAHRGNIDGPNPDRENHPEYLTSAIQAGYDVEVDVWRINDQLLLGHDAPQYPVSVEFLKTPGFWCHAKNLDALVLMLQHPDIHCFWHQNDDFTLTSRGYIWTYPNKPLTPQSICVLPERYEDTTEVQKARGVCSDFVRQY